MSKRIVSFALIITLMMCCVSLTSCYTKHLYYTYDGLSDELIKIEYVKLLPTKRPFDYDKEIIRTLSEEEKEFVLKGMDGVRLDSTEVGIDTLTKELEGLILCYPTYNLIFTQSLIAKEEVEPKDEYYVPDTAYIKSNEKLNKIILDITNATN